MDIQETRDPSDIDWLEMKGHLFPHHDSSELKLESERLVADPSRQVAFLAVSSSQRPVGFVEVSLRSDYVNGTASSPVAFMEAIYVKPEFRRQGIARQLCDAAARWGLGKGCTELASDVLLDNTLGHEMHLGVGFEETERVTYYRKSLA
jgi:aminoglycoside 6'-N-acetyltransferase I